jgi:hypothetical protein
LVNLEYPLATTQQLLHALDTPWTAASVRQQILNQEAGIELFGSGSNQEGEIARALVETWKTGDTFISVQAVPEVKAAYDGHPPKGMEWVVSPSIQDRLQRASPRLKEHAMFFQDDQLPQVVTTVNVWEKKWHRRFISRVTLRNTTMLQALAMFRGKVGYFPTKPVFSEEQLRQRDREIQNAQKKGIIIVPFEEAYDSPGEAAFAQAWRPFETPEAHNIYAPAWQAYEEITTGKFLDADSREEMLKGKQ